MVAVVAEMVVAEMVEFALVPRKTACVVVVVVAAVFVIDGCEPWNAEGARVEEVQPVP